MSNNSFRCSAQLHRPGFLRKSDTPKPKGASATHPSFQHGCMNAIGWIASVCPRGVIIGPLLRMNGARLKGKRLPGVAR